MGQPRFRHELKYVIPLDRANQIVEELALECDKDKHADETASYEIASVYYDTADFQFYVDREESVAYRRKIRLRSYNKNGESQALFIEIKEKHRQFVAKKRINLESKELLELGIPHHRLPLDLVLDYVTDSAEARELHYLHKRLKLEPMVIVRYVRKALIPKYEHDMRVTLDTRVTAGGEYLQRYVSEDEHFCVDPAMGIFEVKSNTGIPLWLQTALMRHELTQTRASKYCLAMDAAFKEKKPWLRTAENQIPDIATEQPSAERFRKVG